MLIHEQMISFYKGFKTDAHPMAIMVINIYLFYLNVIRQEL